jgi:GTP cyclohydrolase I
MLVEKNFQHSHTCQCVEYETYISNSTGVSLSKMNRIVNFYQNIYQSSEHLIIQVLKSTKELYKRRCLRSSYKYLYSRGIRDETAPL